MEDIRAEPLLEKLKKPQLVGYEGERVPLGHLDVYNVNGVVDGQRYHHVQSFFFNPGK